MSLRTLIISLFFGVIVLMLGVGIGVLFQGQKTNPAASGLSPASVDSIKILGSTVASSIIMRGKVSNIEGPSITLLYQSDSAKIKMNGNVKVSQIIPTPPSSSIKSKYTNVAATFNDIKVGDNLEVNVKVLPSGQIEGSTILILPRAT